MGLDAMILFFFFLILSFKLAFSLSFSLIKRLFSSSWLSAITVVSCVYLRLLTFLWAILTPVCNSCSLIIYMICSACKLNKQSDNIQSCRTPFSILNKSVQFLLDPHTDFSETGKMVWYSRHMVIKIRSVQSLHRVRLFVTPWIPAHQAPPVHHELPEFTQTLVHRVDDAIQPSHTLSSPPPPAPNPSQHQGLYQWVNSLHEVAKVLEFQL